MRIENRERGIYLVVTVVILLLLGASYFIARLNSSSQRSLDQSGGTKAQISKIRDALITFVSSNGYLPCPADGSVADIVSTSGEAAPTGPNTNCTAAIGVVPWTTLGLSAADALDAFQNRISYRVYAGTTGLTQAGGATMANCDAVRTAPPSTATIGTDAAGLCRTDHDTSPAQFLSGKGLTVTDNGTAVTGVAFVLIAHGKNGAGAYNRLGARATLPVMASSEYGHTQANGPFVAKPENTVELAPTDPNYFDDAVTYIKISELVSRSNVAARDWPDPASPTLTASTFTAAKISAAAIAAGSTPVGTSTNARIIIVDGITIASDGSAGNEEISSVNGTSGYGIGVLSASATSGGSINNLDKLTLTFPAPGTRFGIMLVDFGTASGQVERAQLTFKSGVATVLTATLLACGSFSVLASYDINVGANFDSVELIPLTRVGSGTKSSFLLGEVKECSSAATSCTTDSATVSTACPYP